MKYFSLLSLIFFVQVTFANCLEVKNFANHANDLYLNQQYLLSLYHYSSATLLECDDQSAKDKAQIGYLYSLYELGEKEEVFRYVLKIDQKLLPEYQKKLDVFKAVKLEVPSSVELLKKRISDFDQWESNLYEPKSNVLAGSMSAILPGAGQAYAGSYQSATVAFLLNALFLSATLELNRKQLPSTALASGLIFSITYLGNIINAAHTASIYNTNFNKAAIKNKQNEVFPELMP